MRAVRSHLSAPPLLASEPGALGELVRAARSYEPRLDQSAAFVRAVERARGSRGRSSTQAWALGFATVCAAIVIAIFSVRDADGPERRESHGVPVPGPRHDRALPSSPALATGPELAPTGVLPAGESRLDDGTRVRLAGASSARVENARGGVRVGLEQGTVTVEVAKQTEGRSFEVRAKAYRFVAIGTAFSVSASGDGVQLDVREGRVAVLQGAKELARVSAGETWTPVRPGPAPRVPTAQPQGLPESASSPEENCLALARSRRSRDAESCFVAQAASGGLGGEMALFELSRLRSDVLGNPAGALTALEEYRARFPSGSLRAEVDISRVHLLSRLGRHAELVAESARLLRAPTGRERGVELHMLRANAFRVGLKDFRSAEREYAEVEKSGGKFATDASFYRAVCLEALGNASGAAQAYRRYLDVPGRSREAEARRRLNELGP